MKRFFSLLSLSIIVISTSCAPNEPKSKKTTEQSIEVSITGKWTLFKEQKNGKVIEVKRNPTVVSIAFEANGYFIFFDKITDKKMIESGVSEIQERYKGQYSLKGTDLKMNHFLKDSLITEEFEVQKLTSDELIVKNKNSKHIAYYKH